MWWDIRMAGTTARSYRPGSWFAIAGERALILLPPGEKARVAALWELVDDGAGFDVTLDALISGGLRDLPTFVLVASEGGRTDVVIRGQAAATFEVDGSEIVVDGARSATWAERTLTGVTRVSVDVEPSPESGGTAYVVAGGVFRVSRIEQIPEVVAPQRSLHVVADEEPAPVIAMPSGPTGPEADEPETDPEPVADESEEHEAEEADGAQAPPQWMRSPEPPAWTPEPVEAPDALGGLMPPPPVIPPPPVVPPVGPPSLPPLPPPPPSLPPGFGTPTLAPDLSAADEPGEPAGSATPGLVRLLISTGESIDIDGVAVIGRAPETKEYDYPDEPLLITVPSAHMEISSAHLEIRPGDDVLALASDLGSTNGTVVVQPGLGPQDLAPGETVELMSGALIDIGDGVTIQVAPVTD
jgi:hypothetical protein